MAGCIEWAFPRDAANAYNHLPWRLLVPLTIDNLLVAGRCASMEHLGQSAARASGACFVMGQAAGTAAAGAASDPAWNGDLRSIDVGRLRDLLRSQGAVLDGTH